uniref:Uncharacterized protein n=1 Tax=Glossina pallidipes TaxID=7398 RepID=A0A1B0A1E8_GLOPL
MNRDRINNRMKIKTYIEINFIYDIIIIIIIIINYVAKDHYHGNYLVYQKDYLLIYFIAAIICNGLTTDSKVGGNCNLFDCNWHRQLVVCGIQLISDEFNANFHFYGSVCQTLLFDFDYNHLNLMRHPTGGV